MARFDYRKLSKQERSELVAELVTAMEAIQRKKDLATFFLQLATPSEAVMMARRWKVAQELAAGKGYRTIAHEMKVGISTIESVDQLLSEAIGDYRARFEEVWEEENKKRIDRYRRHVSPFPNRPAFLLVNLLIDAGAQMWRESTELDRQLKKKK